MKKKILFLTLFLLISSCSISFNNPLLTTNNSPTYTSQQFPSPSISIFPSSNEPISYISEEPITQNDSSNSEPTSNLVIPSTTSNEPPSLIEPTITTSIITHPITSSSSTSIEEPLENRVIPSTNLITNEWEPHALKRSSITSQKYDENSYELSINNSNASETYTTQFLNHNNCVIEGATYKLEFSIKSSISRDIKVIFQEGIDYSYCDVEETISLIASKEQKFSFEFVAKKTKSCMLFGFLTGKIGYNYNGVHTITIFNPNYYMTKEPVENNGLSHTLKNTPNKNGYNLLWADEFNGFSIDETSWSYEEGTAGNGWGNNELQYYTSRIENSYVTNGSLKIVAKKETIDGNGYSSARLRTKDKFEFTYGYIEARIALPSSKGIWPAFWMLGADMDEVGWPNCGEIDILEAINDEDNTVYSALHWYDELTKDHNTLGNDGFTISNRMNYHIYTMEWTSTYIKIYVDGQQSFYFDTTNGNYLGVFNHPYYFTLNVAVGGTWPGFEITEDFPQTMNIDYIRVYQPK